MPRTCTGCSHEQRDAIEDAFIAGTPKRRIASQHGVTERAVRHHIREHLPALLALARDAERAARADTLLDRIEALHSRTLAILEATEQTHDHRTALAAIREARSNLELLAKVLGELDEAPVTNALVSAEWVSVRTAMMEALGGYPDARVAVAERLSELETTRR